MINEVFETRYEWLRPQQLIERRNQCPLVILPIGPLEYHGPHLPLGTDAINATKVAHSCCRKLRKGIVLPTFYVGTERERDPACLKALGFEEDSYIVGMDFPTRLWNSHYLPEEVFGLIIASELKILIDQGYKYVFIANGHGAFNQQEVLRRLCVQYSNTTEAKLETCVSIAQNSIADGAAGHASNIETSLMLHYDPTSVDLGTLPHKDVTFKYRDFSIVDGIGFTDKYDSDHVVRKEDPRKANAEKGQEWFEAAVVEMTEKVNDLIGCS